MRNFSQPKPKLKHPSVILLYELINRKSRLYKFSWKFSRKTRVQGRNQNVAGHCCQVVILWKRGVFHHLDYIKIQYDYTGCLDFHPRTDLQCEWCSGKITLPAIVQCWKCAIGSTVWNSTQNRQVSSHLHNSGIESVQYEYVIFETSILYNIYIGYWRWNDKTGTNR